MRCESLKGLKVAPAGTRKSSPERTISAELDVLVLKYPPAECPGRRATPLLLEHPLGHPCCVMPDAGLDGREPPFVGLSDTSLSSSHVHPPVDLNDSDCAIVRPRAGSRLGQLSRSSFSRYAATATKAGRLGFARNA